jgi:hypothetical protein
MVLPIAPSNYGPPLLDFSPLGNLTSDYFKSAEQRRQYDLARAFQGEVPKKPDGSIDIQAMTETLARHGAVDVPIMQDLVDRSAAQSSSPFGGPQGAPQAPPGAYPQPMAPQAQPAVQPRSMAPAGPPGTGDFRTLAKPAQNQNEGALNQDTQQGESLRTLITGLSGGRDVSDMIPRFEAAFGVKADDPLNPEQEANLKPILARSVAARSQQQAPQQPQSQPAAAPAASPNVGNVALANSVAQANGFPDYRTAIVSLRQYAAKLAGNPRGKEAAIEATQIADQISKALLTPAQFGDIGHDNLGLPVKGFVDPYAQTAKPLSNAGGMGSSGNAGAGLTGEEFLKTLDPNIAATVKAYVEGRSMPVGNARSPQIQAIKQLAAQYEPGFDETVYKSRDSTRRDFSSGTAAKNISSLNTVMGHLNDLREASTKLGQHDWTVLNLIENYAADKLGGSALSDYKLARNAVADEMAKVFRGSGMSEAETERWLNSLDSSKSPEQFKGVFKQALSLLESRMSSLADQYERGMRLGPGAKNIVPTDLLNESARGKIEKIKNWLYPETSRANAVPAGVSQPLQRRPAPPIGEVRSGYRFLGGNPADKSSWQKAQ